ncbi:MULTISPECIES: TlpA disulfide reductase family protein [unclassified Mesorhizobium]|uniref:TlpA family protein disulfide reductase n=3 Tax=Mesorhizobium TaxID=68287 RepID=UPI001FE169C6|nr:MULTISPECIES: TlpA disulfide reductase family protein [unclassified Mesorhizobium]
MSVHDRRQTGRGPFGNAACGLAAHSGGRGAAELRRSRHTRRRPEIGFADAAGQPKTLAAYSGKVVLLNIWATWCAPCRQEMPTLDRLQAELGGPDFEVVALSMDRKGPDAVKKFFAETGVTHLALNIDTSAQAMFTLGAVGLPMTLLIDRQGKEIGRLIGPAEWDAPDMVDFIRGRIAAK